MNIAIFGTGYVGLVSGVCLSEKGHRVFCIDNNKGKIDKIKNGKSPIYEPGLEELLSKNINNISTTTDYISAIKNSEVIFIAVGTPFDGERIDLSFIKAAAVEIGKAIKETNDYKVVVVKSTVVPGTTVSVVKPLVLKHSGKIESEIGFCMNPEFLREGKAVEDFMSPDRIVLGVDSEKVTSIMNNVYSSFEGCEYLYTNTTSAEMIKYTANSYLALNISYANEIGRICEQFPGVDSEVVFNGVVLDKRISPIIEGRRVYPQLNTYLRAGCGFGGSCFPKDVKALDALGKEKNVKGGLLSTLIEINNEQTKHIFELGITNRKEDIKKIAVMGTAFKPDTDDIRESPGIKIIEYGLNRGYEVNVHDYIANENTKRYFSGSINISLFSDPLQAIKNADIIYFMTSWDKYLEYTDEVFKKIMKSNAIIVDARSQFKERPDQSWRIRVGVGYHE